MESYKADALDPTPRTLEQLSSGLASLKELHATRLDAMDKAIEVAHDDLVRVPTDVQKAVGSLRDLIDEKFRTHEEKFAGVKEQFSERDTRADKIADLSQKALDAALLTAEKAVGKQNEAFTAATAKSEAAATKQIDAMMLLINSNTKARDDKFEETNRQLARIDSALAQRDGHSGGSGDAVRWIAGAIVTLGVILGIVEVIIRLSH